MSTNSNNPIALMWCARFFLAVGVAAALFCAYSTIGTLRFISEAFCWAGWFLMTQARTALEPRGGL